MLCVQPEIGRTCSTHCYTKPLLDILCEVCIIKKVLIYSHHA